jgi:magnesium transporter
VVTTWIDVPGLLTEPDLNRALGLGVGTDALDSLAGRHDRPTRQHLGDDLLVAVRPAVYDEADRSVRLGRVAVLLSHQAVLVRHEDGPDATSVRAALRPRGHPGPPSWADVLAAVGTLVVEGYSTALDAIEDELTEIEAAVFGGAVEAPRRVYALSREVIALQRATHPLLGVLEPLPTGTPNGNGATTSRAAAQRLKAVAERARRVVDRVDAVRAALADILVVSFSLVAQEQNARAAELAEIGVRQNEQVKKISAWAAIIVVPTLVTGVYGMNFAEMPELTWRWGYPAVLALMAGLSVGLYVVFRRRGWL